MKNAYVYALAAALFLGFVAVSIQAPNPSSQFATVALFGDSLSYGMDRYAPGVMQGTRFTLSGPGNSFIASNGGKSTTHFFDAARQAITNPAYSVIDFSLGANNPSTAGSHYQQLASLAAQNGKTLMLPVYNHVGGGFDTRASDAAAREMASKYPGTVKLIDYSQVPCFRARNGKDPHVSGDCYKEMARYRQQQLSGAGACLKKTDVTVGFRGIPGGCPGSNPSDGVDTAVNNAGGKIFTYQEGAQALAYVKQQVGNNSNATITIVGHSAGAETAIKLAQQLESANIKVTRLVAADPGSSRSAIPGNVVQAVGLFSTSGKYNGGKLSGKSPVITIQKNVGHCEIDNLIEQAIPCVKCDGNKCEYTGSSICTTDANGKESCTVDPNLSTTQAPPASTPTQQTLPQRLQNLVRTMTGQKPTTSTTNNNQGTNRTNTSSQCPSGYAQSVENGRIICTKQQQTDTVPQCVLVGSSEVVTKGSRLILRWRTAGATRVDISGVAENVPFNGERAVTPESETTYTLTATSESGATKTCDFSVSVENPTGDSGGAAPPTLSCSPSLVERGESSSVRWQCKTGATSSSGVGIVTGGAVSGVRTVTPEHNTEYAVSCTNDDVEVGRNTCSVSVGSPMFDIVAYPQRAGIGDRVRIGWASLFMESCRVVGPRGFDFQRPQGVVITEPFAASGTATSNQTIRAAVYTLSCTSVFGDQVTRDIEVQFRQ